MSKLYLYKADNPNNIIKEVNLSKMYLSVKLDYNLCGIKASEIIHSYLAENVFTEENKCHIIINIYFIIAIKIQRL